MRAQRQDSENEKSNIRMASMWLWSNKFKEIEVTEEVVKYLKQGNRWIIIAVPFQWSQNTSSSSEPPLARVNELSRESNNGF